MALKTFKPTSPGRRFYSVSDFKEITRRKPEKSLTEGQHSTGGRNNKRTDSMIVRRRGTKG